MPVRAAYAIPRGQERPTLSLLRLRLPDHRGRNGSRPRLAARRPGGRGELVEKVTVDEQTIIIKVRRGPLLDRPMSSASDAPSVGAIELTAAVSIKQRGVGTRLVLLDEQQNPAAQCDPAMVKAIARGRAWFEELAGGRARSLQELAKRNGISRRYIRRLVGLAFLSPQLVEAILHGRQPAELTATRLTELDLPLNWAEQDRLLTT